MHVSSRKAFTLIELLVVIAIIAILAVVVVLTLNPAELLRQSRDSNRVSDMDTLTHALSLYEQDLSASSIGTASTTYISIPDPQASTTAGDQCQGLGLATSSLFTWHCAASSTYRNTDGTGWIPVNFSGMSTKSPLGSLPVDPTNQTSSGLFYTYQMQSSQYELTSVMESQKYQSIAQNDGGTYADLFEKGASLALASQDYGNPALSSGSVTQSNMKMSIASNTAFVDFSSAGKLTPYIGDKLTVSDSGGHQLVGWIKAAGSGETYGSETLANTSFNNTTSVSTWQSTIASVSGGESGNGLQITLTVNGDGAAFEFPTVVSGGLYKAYSYTKTGTAGSINMIFSDGNSPNEWYGYAWYNFGAWGLQTVYGTTNSVNAQLQWDVNGSNGNTGYADEASLKQVLTPSATGITIVSASGGSTYNWTSEASGFNRDDSSGYTYMITHS